MTFFKSLPEDTLLILEEGVEIEGYREREKEGEREREREILI